ncbi:MAG: restriction endonuclease subunit S [Candidatus Vogelbacteria bacterium]
MTNWPTKKLGDLLASCDAGVWGKPAAKDTGLFVLRSTNMANDGKLDFSDVPELKIDKNAQKVKLVDGDILLEKSGGGPDQPVGRVAYFVSQDGRAYAFANFIQRLRVKSNVMDSHFLFYRLFFLHKIGFTKKLQSQTTGIRNLKMSLYLKTEIPIPPLATQNQIVERLDKIAEAQKLNEGLIQKSDELFQSLLHKELNLVGKKWEIKKMEALVENVKIGPFGSALKIAELSDNGPVRVLFIENVVNNKFELAKEKYISEKKYKELEVYTVEPDDILITMMGTIGRTCITPENLGRAIISSHLIKITPNKKIAISEYLNFSLHSPYVTDQIRRRAKGAIMKGLNSKILRNLEIPFSPLETQKQIVTKLSAVQNYKKQLLIQKSKLKELFDSALAKSFQYS